MSLLAACCLTMGAVGLLQLGWTALKPLPQEMHAGHGERSGRPAGATRAALPAVAAGAGTLDEDYVRQKASGEIERHLHAEPSA